MKNKNLIKSLAAIAAVTVLIFLAGHILAGVGITAMLVAPSLVKSSKQLAEERKTKETELETLLAQYTEGEEQRALEGDDLETYTTLMEEIRGLDETIEATIQLEEQKRRSASRIGQTQQEKEKREKENYSIIKGLNSFLSKRAMEGFEAEMHQEGIKEAREHNIVLTGEGLVIPRTILDPHPERRDMTVGTATQGGNAVATVLGDFIGYLYDKMLLPTLGAEFMTGLTGNLAFPKETAVPTATWEGETDAGAESNPTVGKVSLTPKRLGTYIDISKLLLVQTSPSIEARIRKQMVRVMKNGLELAAVNGSGVDPIPEGILNTTGIGAVASGAADGTAPTLDHIVQLETEVAQDNADVGSLAYLTNAKVRGFLKTTAKDTGSGLFVWPESNNVLNGYQAGVTNLVPSNLTKGSGTNLSAIIFGNFSDLLIGMWGGMEIIPDNLTQATYGLLRLVINAYADVAVGHPESFAAMKCADLS